MDIEINAPQSENQEADEKAKLLNNGLIWFICFLPLIGLFFENYANSAAAGLVLWILVPLFMIACTVADCKQLDRSGIDPKALYKWVWLTPVYVYKREKLCGRELYKAIMCGFFVIAALFLNGFTQSIKIDGDYMTVSAQNSYVQSLDNFSGSSSKIIGECIEAYLGKNAQWESSKDGDDYTITVTGDHGADKYSVSFLIVYDGFTYQSFKITDVVKNGKSLKGDDFSSACKEIFIEGDNNNDSSIDSAASSSEQ